MLKEVQCVQKCTECSEILKNGKQYLKIFKRIKKCSKLIVDVTMCLNNTFFFQFHNKGSEMFWNV